MRKMRGRPGKANGGAPSRAYVGVEGEGAASLSANRDFQKIDKNSPILPRHPSPLFPVSPWTWMAFGG
jgi:hypothetical protein